MAYADRPAIAGGIAPAEIEIAAGVNGEVAERPEFASGGVDRESFRHGTEIDRKRTAQRDRPRVSVDLDVAISWRFADAAGAVEGVVSRRSGGIGRCGIERAAGVLGDGQCEADGLEDGRTCRRCDADASAHAAQFTAFVEHRAARLDVAEPPERTIDRGVRAVIVSHD